MYRLDTRRTQTRASQLPQTSRNTNPRVSTSTGVIHRTSVSRPQLRSTQLKEKVVQRNSQVKIKQKKVEDHQIISSFSNINKFINDVNARTKKPKAVPISTRKPKKTNQSVATHNKRTVASKSTIQKSSSYFRMLYEEIIRDGENLDKMKEKGNPCILVGYSTQSKGYKVYNKRTGSISESIHINFDEIKELAMMFDDNTLGLAPQLQRTSDHNRSKFGIQDYSNETQSSIQSWFQMLFL
ncbi:hypothetical protein Tco_0507538 [Tanacetum coccineum]